MNDFFNFETLVEELVERAVYSVDIHDLHAAAIKGYLSEFVMDQPTECGKTLRDNLYDLQCISNAIAADSRIDFSMTSKVYRGAYDALIESNEITL